MIDELLHFSAIYLMVSTVTLIWWTFVAVWKYMEAIDLARIQADQNVQPQPLPYDEIARQRPPTYDEEVVTTTTSTSRRRHRRNSSGDDFNSDCNESVGGNADDNASSGTLHGAAIAGAAVVGTVVASASAGGATAGTSNDDRNIPVVPHEEIYSPQ